jgi:hypothetical protein
MSKLWMIGVGVMALSVAGAIAQGEAKQEQAPADKPRHERKERMPKPELKELSMEGVLQKIEQKKKDGTVATSLKLVTDDGTEVMLPKKAGGKDAPAIDMDSQVGSRVKVVGMGSESDKGGKKRCFLKSIKSMEKVVPVAAPAP